jgi:ABC-type glycerol-3-phosphate transport system substrate-binding protein
MFYNESRNLPDLAEIEIGSIGKFFRPPASEVGFRPLNDFIEREGLREKLVASRFAVWSKGDVIFGIPHDVHPVGIVYRKDLFDAAGVNPAQASTWAEFQDKCLAFQAYWRSRQVKRWGLGLSTADADRMLVLLVQRGVNLIDNRNRVHMDDPRVLDTVARYALMVAGPRKIGADETPGGHLWARDLARGEVGALLASDWRVTDLKLAAPEISGRLAMMPLPVWEEGDARTATWGGTMMGIPRNCKDPEESWRLLKWLYFSDAARRAQKRYTDILPPVKEHWAEYMDEEDPYFGGQKVRRLMAELAEDIPEAHVTPFRPWGKEALSVVLARAVDHVNEHGETGLRENCRKWLDELAWELRRRIERGTVE